MQFTDFRAGDATDPNDVMLFSDAQFRDQVAAPEMVHGTIRSIRRDRMVAGLVPARQEVQIFAHRPSFAPSTSDVINSYQANRP
jgi:hypothetical protein